MIFSSPAGMSLTKLSMTGNNWIIPGQGEFSKWHPGAAGDGKNQKLFLQCTQLCRRFMQRRHITSDNPTNRYSRLNFRRQVVRYCSKSEISAIVCRRKFPSFCVLWGFWNSTVFFKAGTILWKSLRCSLQKRFRRSVIEQQGLFVSIVSIPRPIQLLLQVGTAHFGWSANFSCKWWTEIYLFLMMTFYEEYITGETELLAVEHMFKKARWLIQINTSPVRITF